jgi:multidrug resistance efflux pump
MPVGLDLKNEPHAAGSGPPTSAAAGNRPSAPATQPMRGSAKPFARLWRTKSWRLKIGISVALLSAGAYGIFSEEHFVATRNAIVSAYVVSLRTPIDGTIAGLPAAAGILVQEGNLIGRVDNPRVDQQHLQNLRVIEERARSEANAILDERDSLETQRRHLVARSQSYAHAVADRLEIQTKEASRLLNARHIAVRQAAADLARGRELREAGIISSADFEKLQSQYDMAVQEEQAQEANLAAVRVAAAAAAKGVQSEPGATNDVAYSRQRSDEINVHLAEINRDLSALNAQARAAAEDLEKETERMGLMRRADLLAPVSGMLWKLDAMNGERVGTGDAVAEFVDCRQAFVLAEIAQDRVPDIAIGGQARIKLSGESSDRDGTVLSVGGDPRQEDNRKFAAFPLRDTAQQLATVRIGLPVAASNGECIIGRTARVLLPTIHSTILTRWLRGYF